MNKKEIDRYIPLAKEALVYYKCAENGKISNTYRGYISSFGAAIIMGSLKAAIAFNTKQGAAKDDRTQLMKAICAIITSNGKKLNTDNKDTLLDYVINNGDNESEIKEKVYNAAIALKLAMNAFELLKEDGADVPEQES